MAADQINPDDYVITRRRKRYKFAYFANFSNCFEAGEWPGLQGVSLQTQGREVVLELGAGDGGFSLELARRHPDKFYVAADVKADRLYASAKQALAEGVDNVVFLRAHADQLPDLFEPGSVSDIWLTFPDPLPKKRQAKHRLTHSHFLNIYHQLLRDDGRLFLKHDNQDFFIWSLEQLVASGWRINQLSFDLHQSGLTDDYKILTSYEKRWLDEGLLSKFMAATKPTNS